MSGSGEVNCKAGGVDNQPTFDSNHQTAGRESALDLLGRSGGMEGLKACRNGDAAVVGGVGNITRGLLDKVGAEGEVEDGLENTKSAEVKGLSGLGGLGGEEVNKDVMKT